MVGSCNNIKSYYGANGISNSMAWWVLHLVETQVYTINDGYERFKLVLRDKF